MAFREIYRGNTVKLGLGIPERRSGGQRYRNFPKSQVRLQYVEPSPIYVPPASTVVVVEEPREAQPPEPSVPIEVVAEKLKEHFESGDALAEPSEVQADEVNEGEYSLVLRWFPDTGFGDLRRSTGEIIGFAHWSIESIGIERIKPNKTWVRHHVEQVQGKKGMRTVACDIYICKETDDD